MALINKTVIVNGARVRTGCSTIYPASPGYPDGLAYGAVVACRGYLKGQDPYGNGNPYWIETKSGWGYFIHSSNIAGGVSGLPYLGNYGGQI